MRNEKATPACSGRGLKKSYGILTIRNDNDSASTDCRPARRLAGLLVGHPRQLHTELFEVKHPSMAY